MIDKTFLKTCLLLIVALIIQSNAFSQEYTRADTLRGSITPERAWWDVMRYDISVTPDFDKKYTAGYNNITYKVIQEKHPDRMQIDLQQPLAIDSIVYDDSRSLNFSREGNVYHVETPVQTMGSEHQVKIYFSGKPHEAVRPPWDGGWSFSRDEKGRPWMTVTCQGLGASIWYPNKDHQSDEPDRGASLNMRVPKELMAVANGRLIEKMEHQDGTTSYKWGVENPISNYTIIPYIGHYKNFSEEYTGVKGKLDLNYWVMDYHLEKAKNYMPPEVHNMLNAFEYWFGPYPFYEDGYKLVETDNTGMEHQSNVSYGNWYAGGYRGRDGSGTGLGLTWDFIIIHESGHEWFGNNITTNDLADMYIHESFTNYSETLFLDYVYGEEAANDYNFGIRRGIQNDRPVIPAYGVNAKGSGDMYPKGGNMLHTIRHSMDDDKLFKNILTGLNLTFHNQTVNGETIQEYISEKAGYDYAGVFEQYLTTTKIPVLQLYIDAPNDQIFYRYQNVVDNFNLPLVLKGSSEKLNIQPTREWQSIPITNSNQYLFTPWRIEYMYYLKVEIVKER
ncbi:M1 family metallopeptidase [Christiangramia flava]|uniref:Peptidase M1 family protein n=1 Tax=Christiangramia flava JLT2011 TaxID=1229726 RepID=A0A1L7I2L0_9FLAO|nr:M1 family metallopeptidase [Christiangramia flava]APU67312.1 Peptidase M1 family protein [Christiangramia flava JLT2011]OSS39897.1 Peptidase M1 family protein [Christiangramia flava JLT2011]